ncbi:hypothetical protein HY643_03795, partial [Candidatus Woesearchaeota archaeon]|nr:hypothetical protein [Candidatus Woesearchaeota archaeon]
NKDLINKLAEQLGCEIAARDFYGGVIKKLSDDKIISVLKEIRGEEIKHVKIVENLQNIVKNYNMPLTKVVEKKLPKNDALLKKISGGEQVLLLISKVEDYVQYILFILNNLVNKKRVIYISYNKLPKYLKALLKSHNINASNIFFINCANISSDSDLVIGPEDLTKLSIGVAEAVKNFKDVVVLVDTVSSFSVYHNTNTICQFVASMNDAARNKGYQIIWVAVDDPSNKPLNSALSQLCDKIVKM